MQTFRGYVHMPSLTKSEQYWRSSSFTQSIFLAISSLCDSRAALLLSNSMSQNWYRSTGPSFRKPFICPSTKSLQGKNQWNCGEPRPHSTPLTFSGPTICRRLCSLVARSHPTISAHCSRSSAFRPQHVGRAHPWPENRRRYSSPASSAFATRNVSADFRRRSFS